MLDTLFTLKVVSQIWWFSTDIAAEFGDLTVKMKFVRARRQACTSLSDLIRHCGEISKPLKTTPYPIRVTTVGTQTFLYRAYACKACGEGLGSWRGLCKRAHKFWPGLVMFHASVSGTSKFPASAACHAQPAQNAAHPDTCLTQPDQTRGWTHRCPAWCMHQSTVSANKALRHCLSCQTVLQSTLPIIIAWDQYPHSTIP